MALRPKYRAAGPEAKLRVPPETTALPPKYWWHLMFSERSGQVISNSAEEQTTAKSISDPLRHQCLADIVLMAGIPCNHNGTDRHSVSPSRKSTWRSPDAAAFCQVRTMTFLRAKTSSDGVKKSAVGRLSFRCPRKRVLERISDSVRDHQKVNQSSQKAASFLKKFLTGFYFREGAVIIPARVHCNHSTNS